jgi:hypothetical protein
MDSYHIPEEFEVYFLVGSVVQLSPEPQKARLDGANNNLRSKKYVERLDVVDS